MNIVTTGFVDGVEAQSESLGFDPAVVYVPHPIQNRTKAEIEAIADDAFAKVMTLLRSRPERSEGPHRRRGRLCRRRHEILRFAQDDWGEVGPVGLAARTSSFLRIASSP